MSRDLTHLLVRRFISRRDVKARQTNSGEYIPDTLYRNGPYAPWTRSDLEEHLSGTTTYGHYVLDADDTCKLFCFDIDLEKEGTLPTVPCPLEDEDQNIELWTRSFVNTNPREVWLERDHPARGWMKYQMRAIAGRLAATAHRDLGMRVAVTYTGSKGVHVYCFFEERDTGKRARDGASLLLEALGDWKLHRGNNVYKHADGDPYSGFPNFTIEVYPKQVSLEGKHLGNLLRLPLGRNRKNPRDPTFFVDLRAPYTELRPCDPTWALTTDDPWR